MQSNIPNIILDALPTEWKGGALKTDFKQVLKFFRLHEDDSFDDEEKVFLIINLFFETMPEDFEDLDGFLKWYLSRGQEGEDGEKVFDFEQDSGRLYSSFRMAYGIDLRKEKLHWFEFLELFSGLPEDTALMKVIDIRTKKEIKGDKEYNAALRKIKARVALHNKDETPVSLASFFGLGG